MDNQNLLFNILPFDWPREDITFYFHKNEQPNCHRLGSALFPKKLHSIFPSMEREGQAFVVTSFDQPTEGFVPLDIDLRHDNPQLAKLYFHYKLHRYFQSLGHMVVRNGFGKGVQVWVPAFKLHTTECLVYECFRLRVQVGTVSPLPQLLTRYERAVRVYRHGVAPIVHQVPPALFQWLLVGNRLVRYADYMKEKDTDYGSALPVLTKEISKVLGLPAKATEEDNPYRKHYRYIKGFYEKFLDHETFRAVVPIHQQFLRVRPEIVRRLPYTEQEQPSIPDVGAVAQDGKPVLKPYQKSPHVHTHLFFVAHRDHAALIETVKRYFFQGVGWFQGLSKFAQLNVYPQKDMDIIFDDFVNTLPVVRRTLDRCLLQQSADVTYIGIYISPYSQDEPDARKRVLYHYVKHLLLERGITLQVLEAAKLSDPKVPYADCMANISVGMLAKLGGIPWRLRVPVRHELVVGVGIREGVGGHFIGVAVSFSNEGRFERFDCFQPHQLDQLAGFVSYGVRSFAQQHHYPERLVIHCRQSDRSRALVGEIINAICALEFPKPVPVFILSMCGGVSEDVILFDTGWSELMPYSGTVVRVGIHQYLLFHNMRYEGGGFDALDGGNMRDHFPLPMKVKASCTDKALLENEEGVMELLGQVHQFSRMYWRSVRQQNMPVTVRYAEMIAEMVGYFPGGRLPEGGKRGLWFL